MKNAIKYYYNLEIASIRQTNKKYFFENNNNQFVLINYNGEDILEIYKLNNQLISSNFKTNVIILNNNNEIITIINNEKYVLLKIVNEIRKITLNDIIGFSNIIIEKKENNWFELWTKKIDYFEYQINQSGLKYKLIRESFSYYIGLSELAIILIKNIKSGYHSLNHKRINYNDTTFELYNPLNYMTDYRFRDVCEYFKSAFFNGINITENVKIYLNNLLNEEKYLFFSRLVFPTYYFDYYEKIIMKEIEEKEITKIISKVNEYEKFLIEIYIYLGNILPEIEALKKLSYIDNF